MLPGGPAGILLLLRGREAPSTAHLSPLLELLINRSPFTLSRRSSPMEGSFSPLTPPVRWLQSLDFHFTRLVFAPRMDNVTFPFHRYTLHTTFTFLLVIKSHFVLYILSCGQFSNLSPWCTFSGADYPLIIHLQSPFLFDSFRSFVLKKEIIIEGESQ